MQMIICSNLNLSISSCLIISFELYTRGLSGIRCLSIIIPKEPTSDWSIIHDFIRETASFVQQILETVQRFCFYNFWQPIPLVSYPLRNKFLTDYFAEVFLIQFQAVSMEIDRTWPSKTLRWIHIFQTRYDLVRSKGYFYRTKPINVRNMFALAFTSSCDIILKSICPTLTFGKSRSSGYGICTGLRLNYFLIYHN